MDDSRVKGIFWVIVIFVALISVFVTFMSPVAGIFMLLFTALTVVLIRTIAPEFWERVRFQPRSKEQGSDFEVRAQLKNANDPTDVIPITKPYFTMGRDRNCDFQLPPSDLSISRNHCAIRYREESKLYWLVDTRKPGGADGPKNGTRISQRRVPRGSEQHLNFGDRIYIGSSCYIFEKFRD